MDLFLLQNGVNIKTVRFFCYINKERVTNNWVKNKYLCLYFFNIDFNRGENWNNEMSMVYLYLNNFMVKFYLSNFNILGIIEVRKIYNFWKKESFRVKILSVDVQFIILFPPPLPSEGKEGEFLCSFCADFLSEFLHGLHTACTS